MPSEEKPAYFDVAYGLASISFTTGLTIIATTEADYHGVAVVASATQASITIYDNASATTGNIVDIFLVATTKDVWIDRYIPIKAKKGLVIKATGAGLQGACFYGPKG